MRVRSRSVLVVMAIVAASGGSVAEAHPNGAHGVSGFAAVVSAGTYGDDFNGDGIRDYAYGQSVTDAGSAGSGTVGVVYGTAAGPDGRKQNLTQNSKGVPGTNEWDDEFGNALAAADFNGDGYGDLAVGVPGEDVGKTGDEGAVTILWGSAAGLSGGTSVKNPAPRHYGAFGQGLVAADFNGDGRPDLAVLDGGTAYVYLGTFGKTGFKGKVVTLTDDDMVAQGLAAGRVTKDKAAGLVVLGQNEDESGKGGDAVRFVRGGSTLKPGKTLTLAGDDSLLGLGATVADFDQDGYGDIAVGHPYASGRKGSVVVWHGGASGPSGTVTLTQNTSGVAGTAETGDEFGGALGTGDVNHDGYPDLAVAAPGESLGKAAHAGAIHVLYGGPKGLTGAKSQFIDRATPGVPDAPETDERFGSQLRLRDSDHDGHADLFTDYLRFPGTAKGLSLSGVEGAISSAFLA
jgi:hypothetical protein